MLLLFLFDKSLFGLSKFVSFLGVAVLLRNEVISSLGHDFSSKCMVEEGGGKSEAFSLGKTENLFEIVKSFVLLVAFSC